MINASDIISAIKPIAMGQHPGDVVDALLTSAVCMVKMTSSMKEQDLTDRLEEIWRLYEAGKKVGGRRAESS